MNALKARYKAALTHLYHTGNETLTITLKIAYKRYMDSEGDRKRWRDSKRGALERALLLAEKTDSP